MLNQKNDQNDNSKLKNDGLETMPKFVTWRMLADTQFTENIT